jgi:Glycine-zipper domain
MKPTSMRTGRTTSAVVVAILALVLSYESASWAQSAPIIYPSAGQSLEKQSSDEAACRTWAQQQTGFYPGQSAPGYYGNPYNQAGAPVLGGAARGAALGAVGGAIAGDAGKGAGIGAAVGATAGFMRRNQERRQQAYANDQAMAQYQAEAGRYNQAFAACMQGRGYVVR